MRIHAEPGPGIPLVRERTGQTLDTVPTSEPPVTPRSPTTPRPVGGRRMKTLQDVQTWRGQTAFDNDGDKIGTIEDIYLDRQSGDPEWATVKTGLFGSKVHFVPIGDASATEDGVRLPYAKDQVKDAPNLDADGQLSEDEERSLYDHYGRGEYDWSGEDRTQGLGLADDDRDDRFSREDGESGKSGKSGKRGTVGRDTSGPTTDDAMTPSEEELQVGTQRRERGRARLRKYVVTENVQQTVPVEREEVRVEREPITDANADRALDGPDISEEEHEVVLHEEEPVVEKRAVPKERVRLDKDVVTDEETISEDVRKERIEAEGDAKDRL